MSKLPKVTIGKYCDLGQIKLDSNSGLWSKILCLIYFLLCNVKNVGKTEGFKIIDKLRKILKVKNHGYYIWHIYSISLMTHIYVIYIVFVLWHIYVTYIWHIYMHLKINIWKAFMFIKLHLDSPVLYSLKWLRVLKWVRKQHVYANYEMKSVSIYVRTF